MMTWELTFSIPLPEDTNARDMAVIALSASGLSNELYDLALKRARNIEGLPSGYVRRRLRIKEED